MLDHDQFAVFVKLSMTAEEAIFGMLVTSDYLQSGNRMNITLDSLVTIAARSTNEACLMG